MNTDEARTNNESDEAANNDAVTYDDIQAGQLEIKDLPPIDVRKLRRIIMHVQLGRELLGDKSMMLTMQEALDSATQWYDFVGTDDILTSWQNHVTATSRRESPTRQTVLEGVGHDWPLIRMPFTARLAEVSLEED